MSHQRSTQSFMFLLLDCQCFTKLLLGDEIHLDQHVTKSFRSHIFPPLVKKLLAHSSTNLPTGFCDLINVSGYENEKFRKFFRIFQRERKSAVNQQFYLHVRNKKIQKKAELCARPPKPYWFPFIGLTINDKYNIDKHFIVINCTFLNTFVKINRIL